MRLIDADSLKVYYGVNVGVDHGGLRAVVYKKDIDAAPTIDPVKHGKWIFDREVRFDVCSECGLYGVSDMKYCPNCGAHMDKGDEDD